MSPKKRGQPARRPPARKASPAKRSAAARQTGTRQHAAGGAASQRSFYTPRSSPLRRVVERRSAPVLVLLTQLPRFVMAVAPLALLVLGVLLPLAFGLLALVLVLLLTGWLAYLSWPQADGRGRTMRSVILLVMLGILALRIARG